MIDCVLLVGGLGKRLQSVVSGKPKPLAAVNGIPFLDLLLRQLASFAQIRKVILAVGYLKEQIIEQYQKHSYPYEIAFSLEETPLGTGGALQKALKQTTSDIVLAMNGDSFLEFEFSSFLNTHQQTRADFSLIYREVPDISRYGHLYINPQTGQILNFEEKTGRPEKGLINGGVYLLAPNLLSSLQIGTAYSLETDAFPRLLKKRVFGYACQGLFIDIGTPDSFAQAQTLFNYKMV